MTTTIILGDISFYIAGILTVVFLAKIKAWLLDEFFKVEHDIESKL